MQEISATKQKILIVGLIGALILVIVMVSVMFLGGKKDNSQEIVNSTNKETEPSQNSKIADKNEEGKKDGTFLKIATGGVYGLKIKKGTNQIMFYQQQKLLTADPFSGQKHSVGSYPFAEVTEFVWSKNTDKALVKDTGEYYIYESDKNLSHEFNYKVDTAIWNETGDKIIYKYYDSETGERAIIAVNVAEKVGKTLISNLPYRKIDLTIQPKTENVCYFPYPDARVKGKLFCKSLNGEIKKEYGSHYGQDYLWSPDGSKLLTSFTKEESGNNLVLGVMNKTGGGEKGLSLGTTVKKCVWSKNNVDVYCAVLGGAPLAIMLPNAWDEQLFNSVDTFWKINTETGEKKRLVSLEKMTFVIDSENLTLDTEENFLFFVSRRDRSLWRLKL